MVFLIERIHIENVGGRIRLRWRYKGEVYPLSLGLDYTEENLSKAQIKRAEIYSDIISNCFDHSLDKYREIKVKVVVAKPGSFCYITMFEYWVTNILNQDLANNANYFGIRYALKRWDIKRPDEIVVKLQEAKINHTTYNRRLKVLKSFLDWLQSRQHIRFNPLAEIGRKRETVPSNEKRKPLSQQEMTLFLEAIRKDDFSSSASIFKHSFYYPFFYTVFRTGMRNQEVIGLPVKNVDFGRKLIKIDTVLARCEGKAYRRRAKEPKANKIRYIPIPDDLVDILKSVTKGKQPSDLVFTSPMGKVLNDANLQRRVFFPVLRELKIPKRDLYSSRHGFCSRAIEQGIGVLQVSELMGNSPKTVLKNYTHLLNKPTALPSM